MIRKQPWFERQFPTGLPVDLFPVVVERLRDAAPLGTILSGFRQARSVLVRRLEAVEDAALAYTAPHPRLRVPMSLVDHTFFVAEHDDYHLARITELLSEFGLG